ncbi:MULTISPECIES: hypothetical protein [unclassified Aeromicrobium]|uniref:hypothetical protein n=1 Tax=unclassified Aeromicrobium TaxID=2633570 RepID=UPI00396B3DC1
MPRPSAVHVSTRFQEKARSESSTATVDSCSVTRISPSSAPSTSPAGTARETTVPLSVMNVVPRSRPRT